MEKLHLKSFMKGLLFLFLIGSMGTFVACSDDDDTPIIDTPDPDPDPDPDPEVGTIVDLAVENNFTVLAAALTEAGLIETLQGAGPFTVFAPTDEAFAAINITTANVGEVEGLADLLTYHLVSGNISSDQLTTGDVATVNGETIAIDAGALTVNGVSIIAPFDVAASNGVIHTIDEVLIPPAAPLPSIVEAASTLPSLS